MDKLHDVLRTLSGETKARRDPLAPFRAFLSQLDRLGKRAPPPRAPRPPAGGKRPARRS